MSIQWQKLNVNISGETDRNLTFLPVEFGDEGVYRCIVTTLDFGVHELDGVTLTGVLLK